MKCLLFLAAFTLRARKPCLRLSKFVSYILKMLNQHDCTGMTKNLGSLISGVPSKSAARDGDLRLHVPSLYKNVYNRRNFRCPTLKFPPKFPMTFVSFLVICQKILLFQPFTRKSSLIHRKLLKVSLFRPSLGSPPH